jgi:hypothetical protein
LKLAQFAIAQYFVDAVGLTRFADMLVHVAPLENPENASQSQVLLQSNGVMKTTLL